MNKQFQAALLLIMAGSVSAGDLVMKLGTTQSPVYHRVPVTGNITVSPATGDIIVDPVANAGVANDGWCPASGGGGPTCTAPGTFTTQLAVSTASLPAGGGSKPGCLYGYVQPVGCRLEWHGDEPDHGFPERLRQLYV
jgi:hypothetical protein